MKSRKSDKESPKKTQTRLERQLPYNPGPGRVAPRAIRPARRKPQRPLRSAAQRPAASARSSSFLARSSSSWKVQNPKKRSTAGNGTSGTPKTCARRSLLCRSTPASNEVAMTTRNGSFPNATPSANGLFRRRFPDQTPGEWQFRGFCFLTLPPPIAP